ncbi:MAG: hypothetical protein EPN47_13875 [Acidobacteria bacterium]|nr:MAG: hypothetical protein EPN47_13875 [Acidobacteriota bacterium]
MTAVNGVGGKEAAMAEKRDEVFIWITWLSKVMAGEHACEWASWFKAHHENYAKVPSDFDIAKWKIEHTRRLRELRLQRQKLGERVFVEGENQIRCASPQGMIVAGKPDLISVRNGAPKIYDVKTGQPRSSNEVQVMLYMHLLPQAIPAYRGMRPTGCVVYNDSRVEIPAEAVDESFAENFEYFLDVIGSEAAAIKVPSRNECKFCDIAKSECPERIEG